MPFRTASISALHAHPVAAALPAAFLASITEGVPTLSVWRNVKSPLPVGTRWDSASNSIVFPEPIELARLGNVYDATAKGFLYIPNYAGYGATLSADGRFLRCGKLHPEALNGDTLAGTYARDVTAEEAGGSNQDVPADWTRPVLVVDLTQINDSRLYDGGFPAYCLEARTITSKAPAHCLWCYVSEIAVGGAAPVIDAASKAELAKYKAAVATLNESIK